VLAIGLILAGLSYFFHPEVDQFSFMINDQPVPESLVRFSAIPTFVVILGLSLVLSVLIFLGIGFFVMIGGVLMTVILLFILAPYLWPLLLVIFLIIAVMSVGAEQQSH
jgi:hypothetical protein